MFDRLFHLTRGGVSKASKVINLSEDIFAGKEMSMSSLFAFMFESYFHLTFLFVQSFIEIHCYLKASTLPSVKEMLLIMSTYKLGKGEMWV